MSRDATPEPSNSEGSGGARIRRELLRAPTVGLTRGELAILLVDVDDDLVSLALEREIAAGRVVVQFYFVDAPAAAAEFGNRPMTPLPPEQRNVNPRYAHREDYEYRRALEEAIRQARSALSPTAIDHYAQEKLENAAQAIERARRRFAEIHPDRDDWLGQWERSSS
jgi:hypothetical protein